MLQDIAAMQNVTIVGDAVASLPYLVRQLHRFHYHQLFNRFFEIPFKGVWNHLYYDDNNPDYHKPKCFVFMMTWIRKDKECFFRYLKEKFPNSKFVLYLEDVISSRKEGDFCFRLVDEYFDLAISFDEGDAKKYGYKYYPTFISSFMLPEDNNIPHSDLFYCGAPKKRLDMILKAYGWAKNSGLNVDFCIAKMQNIKVINGFDGIQCISGLWSYDTYLKHMNKTSCILEVMQENASGYTLRTWEALMFDKKLITNNKNIINASFYNENQFIYFEDINSITSDILRRTFLPCSIEEKKKYSPINLLYFINDNL